MGFDPRKVRTLDKLLDEPRWDFGVGQFADVDVRSDDPEIARCLENTSDRFATFRPYPGWVGHLEI